MKHCTAIMAGLGAALGVTSCSQKTEPPEAPPFMQAPSAAAPAVADTSAGAGTTAPSEPVASDSAPEPRGAGGSNSP